MKELVLEVRGLSVEFTSKHGVVQAVRGASFGVSRGETLAIVGESGCGKSTAAQAVMGLVPSPPGRIVSGSARLAGLELIGLPPRRLNRVRGSQISMIFRIP